MATRPNFIDLRSKSQETVQSSNPSPRMQHFDGDIPPAMSPLDMFAMQSRLLAKQLDDSKRSGRRVSRLPPLTTGDPITKQKTIYNKSRSTENKALSSSGSSPRAKEEDSSGIVPALEEPNFRPKSYYPRMSSIPHVEDDTTEESVGPSPDQLFVTPAEFQPQRTNDYFGVPRAKSPELAPPAQKGAEYTDRNPWVNYPKHNYEATQPNNDLQRGMSIESTSTKSNNGSLAPPMSPHFRHAGSIRSVAQDSSDEELSASTGGSGFSRDRKLSSSSGVSMPHSPFSPFAQAHARSPSLNSEYSIGGSRYIRPAYNFSRPISRASQPSAEVTSRQPSFDHRPSIDAVRPHFTSMSRQPSSDSQRMIFTDDPTHTPISTDNEHSPELKESQDAPAPSYIYAKFSLPRGRMVQRDSMMLTNDQVPQFEWERPAMQTNVRPTTPLAQKPMSPPPSPPRSSEPSFELQRSSPSPRPSTDHKSRDSPRPSTEQHSRESPRPSTEQSQQGQERPRTKPVSNDDKSEYSASTRSGSTIKARPRAPAPSLDMTGEQHLAKGIELHERGAARESTYHPYSHATLCFSLPPRLGYAS